MNNKIKLVIYIIVFILILIGANILYYNIKNNNKEYINQMQEEQIEGQKEQQDANFAIDFTVYDKENNAINLSDYKGKPIVVNFWATWCNPCKMELPDFNEVYEQEKENVIFLMVNATDGMQEMKEKAIEFVEKEKYTFPVYYDMEEEAIQNYRITGFPTTIFIDKNFNIITEYQGMIDKDILIQNINKIK